MFASHFLYLGHPAVFSLLIKSRKDFSYSISVVMYGNDIVDKTWKWRPVNVIDMLVKHERMLHTIKFGMDNWYHSFLNFLSQDLWQLNERCKYKRMSSLKIALVNDCFLQNRLVNLLCRNSVICGCICIGTLNRAVCPLLGQIYSITQLLHQN